MKVYREDRVLEEDREGHVEGRGKGGYRGSTDRKSE